MSVTTDADVKLKEAREKLREAHDALHTIVIDKCWGHADFNEEWRTKIKEAFIATQALMLSLEPKW